MRTINKSEIGEKLCHLLDEAYPVDEDIGILNERGAVSGVVITKEAYEFFLRKIEEHEGRLDGVTVREFNESGEKIRRGNDHLKVRHQVAICQRC